MAFKLLERDEIPAIIQQADDSQSAVLAVVENLQRRDLNFYEEAAAIDKLIKSSGLTQQQAADKLGISQAAVANKLRNLKLPPEILKQLVTASLTERHARALLRLTTEQDKLRVIALVVQMNMSVARTERYIEQQLEGKEDKPSIPNLGQFLSNISQSLSKFQLSGIPAISERRETEAEIVLTITIPKGGGGN